MKPDGAHRPLRTCAGCGSRQEKSELLRIVRTPEGLVMTDPSGKRNGRGVYICRSEACLERARKRRSLERGLRTAVPPEVFEAIRKELAERAAEQNAVSDRDRDEGGPGRGR